MLCDVAVLEPYARKIHAKLSPFYDALIKESWYASHVQCLQDI